MPSSTTLRRSVALAAVVLAGACTDNSGPMEPAGPSAPSIQPLSSGTQQGQSDDPNVLAR